MAFRLSILFLVLQKKSIRWRCARLIQNELFFTGRANDDEKRDELNTDSEKPCKLLWEMIELPVLLTLIGISSAVVSYVTSKIVAFGNGFRWQLAGSPSDYYAWIYYCLWCQVIETVQTSKLMFSMTGHH